MNSLLSDKFQFSSTKLCFEPSDFHADEFSIDEFIQKKRKVVPLDVLRDDLGAYLKSLRSSLIELINHDYGQFVNLSSNLVGLDSQIYNITKPLKFVQQDFETLRSQLQSTLDAIKLQLHEKSTFHRVKSYLQYLRLTSTALESAESYMKHISSVTNSEISINDNLRTLLVLCDEVAQVQFLLEKCNEISRMGVCSSETDEEKPSSTKQQSPCFIDLQNRYEACSSFIFVKLDYLLEYFGNQSISPALEASVKTEILSKVKSVLYSFLELKHERRAEELFVSKILQPRCGEILSKKGNITSLLEEVEVFLTNCPLTIISQQVHVWPWLANYSFITNGVFPYIIQIFKKHFPHIWSPSNPDQFFTNWKRFEVFIERIENCLPSKDHLLAFRKSELLAEFISKWQLNVYFQLRFHNLAIELEAALDYLVTSPCATPDFKLDATRILVNVINQCWDSEKLFIVQLTGRFLKANALFIARYLKEVSTQASKISHASITKDDKQFNNTISRQDVGHPTTTTSSQMVLQIQQLISIYYDVNLSEFVLGQILHEKFESVVSGHIKMTPLSDFDDYKKDTTSNDCSIQTSVTFVSQFPWDATKKSIESQLTEIVLSQIIIHISSVTEVPRLFRRTNREIPTSHSEYINTMLLPLQTFSSISSQYDSSHKLEVWDNVIGNIGTQLCQRYANQAQEVLTSVQKMEESLKRLKKVKTGAAAIDNAKIVNNNNKMSDDDKIRKQIQIDVEYLISQVKQLSPTIDTSTLEHDGSPVPFRFVRTTLN